MSRRGHAQQVHRVVHFAAAVPEDLPVAASKAKIRGLSAGATSSVPRS